MAMFKAFKPEAMNKIANAMGYTGNMSEFQQYIEQDPARQQQMNMYTNAAKMMAKGGIVKRMAVGGTVTNPQGTQAATPVVTGASTPAAGQPGIGQFSVEQMYTPGVPIGGTTIAAQTATDPSQDIAAGTGQITGQVAVPTAQATTAQATPAAQTQANTMQASQAAPAVDNKTPQSADN